MKVISLQTGDIVLQRVSFKESAGKRKGFAKIRALLPWLIRVFDGGYYNHVYTVYNEGILDGDFPKVVKRSFVWLKGQRVKVLRLHQDLSPNEIKKYSEYCKLLLGTDYKISHLLVHLIKSMTGIWLGSWSEKSGVCSKFSLFPINKVRGYFPRFPQMSPNDIDKCFAGYYYVAFEGVLT
jgi:hypothetical protein